MPRDPYIREKFTRESSTARSAVREYFKRYPKEQFLTELETWCYLPSQTIEFVMKRLREPDRGRWFMSSARGWKRTFDDPIPLPRGRQLEMRLSTEATSIFMHV